MKVAVYNRYWTTLGGGERYAGGLAEALCCARESAATDVSAKTKATVAVQGVRPRFGMADLACSGELPDDLTTSKLHRSFLGWTGGRVDG